MGYEKEAAKGIATHVLGIILIIAIFMFFTLLLVYGWVNTTSQQANETLCAAKILNYCADWLRNGFKERPWNWNDKGPQGCEKFHINPPVSSDDCTKL